ncbi:MAG: formate dehydrogenase [Desulfobacca sp.]|nr:formate dehydrogenase [Desulfobacca sp.]
MADKSIFIDTSKCTACRGCQMACKQWNRQGTEKTVNRGSHQNPPDFSSSAYKIVRFSEGVVDGKPFWYFFPDQCRHCVEPPCKETADTMVKNAILRDEKTGAVIYTSQTRKLKAPEIVQSCPYHIPTVNLETKTLTKCNLCFDRITNGLQPACVKTCPSGTMSFGDRPEILARAKKRLAEVKGKFPKASLLDADDVRVIYLITDDRTKYHRFASADEMGITRTMALRKLLKPMTGLAAAAVLIGGMIQESDQEIPKLPR